MKRTNYPFANFKTFTKTKMRHIIKGLHSTSSSLANGLITLSRYVGQNLWLTSDSNTYVLQRKNSY
jgi:hypothetical protein